jgi:hypothetical protein
MNMIDYNAAITEIFKKHGVEDHRFYPVTKLHELMVDIGITNMKRASFTTDFINRKVGTGEIIMPPKRPFGRWKLTGSQMRGVVNAFLPGESGYWSYITHEPNDGRLKKEQGVGHEEMETQAIPEGTGQQDDDSSS